MMPFKINNFEFHSGKKTSFINEMKENEIWPRSIG